MRRLDISKVAIPVCNEGNGYKQFAVFRGALELYDFCINQPDDKRCLFEIIRGYLYQKIYFDVDIALDELSKQFNHTREQKINISKQIPRFLSECIIKLRPEIATTDIMVFTSHSNNKRSFHIVVDRWCVTSAKQNRRFFECVMAYIPAPWRQYFDSSMYKSIQQFRLYMSTKFGKGRMKILDPTDSTWVPDDGISREECNRQVFLCSLITRTDNCYVLPFDEEEEEDVEYDTIDVNDVEAVKLFEIIKTMPYAGCFSIVERKNNLVVMKRLMPSFCSVCETTHDNENPCVVVSPNGNVNLDCRRHPEKKKLHLGNIFDDTVHINGPAEANVESREVPFFEVRQKTSESPPSDTSPMSVISTFSGVSPISITATVDKYVSNKYEKKGQEMAEKRKNRSRLAASFASLT